jgi:Periplasmic component of the Tol biopolymer transport system
MRDLLRTALCLSLLLPASAFGLAEFGIEGLWTVSTRDDELRASVSPDGQAIVWASDRAGGAGGMDLWIARRDGIRWVDPQPLPFNTPGPETEPAFSPDGRWLYFASQRKGGRGGLDLYRVAFDGQRWGTPEPLAALNTPGDEHSPTPAHDRLLFASNGHNAGGALDLFAARIRPDGRHELAGPLPGINTGADELDVVELDGGRALLFARRDRSTGNARLYLAVCQGAAYAEQGPWGLSFNSEERSTRAPVVDLSRPADLLVTGSAPAPKAGKGDLYRVAAPTLRGADGCMPGA